MGQDPDLLKKLSRKHPTIFRQLFNMDDRYASQEEGMATKNDDQPHQKEKKDATEFSKPKNCKCQGEIMVTTIEHSQSPHAPRTDDFEKVMKYQCPFHPMGKHVT